MKKKSVDAILCIFLALAILLSIVNFSLISARSKQIKDAALLAEKENQPAKLELIKIISSSCKDCFDINPVVESLKKANVDVTSERALEFQSEEAKQLINQYGIEKLPTVVVLGELNKPSVVNSWNQNWKVNTKDGLPVSAVYSAVVPLYVNASGSIKGIISLTQISDESCQKCANLTPIISFFEQSGVKFSKQKKIDYSSPEAKDLISKFGIRRVPAIIVSKNILDYPDIAKVWSQLNATEKQGFYAVHTTIPPFRDLGTNKVQGLVSVIYLKDSTCASCYDVFVNKPILERLGVAIANETTVDASDAAPLLAKYNITKIPVILISQDANAYDTFTRVWPSVGSHENDGWYVMRKPGALGAYKDLSSGQVIQPQQQNGG